jgi:hypothetical protein
VTEKNDHNWSKIEGVRPIAGYFKSVVSKKHTDKTYLGKKPGMFTKNNKQDELWNIQDLRRQSERWKEELAL